MQLSDKIKKFSVEQAIDYLNKNPVKNLPKLLDWADTFCAGKFEGQRRAIRKACMDPNDAHYPMVQHILNDIDPAVLKTTLVNFFIYGNIIGCERQDQLRAQYQCNIPWAILMDPTSACNLHCTGCWVAEYGNKLNLSLDELDDIIRQGRDMGVYFYIYTGGEPLVRKKDIITLCERHPDCEFLSFTNGTLIDEAFADEMLRVKNFIPAISLEGDETTTDSRRGAGTYQKVLRAIDLLHERKLIYGISSCYTSVNWDAISSEAYFRQLIDFGCLFIWYFHYMPVGNDAAVELLPTMEQRKYMRERVREIRNMSHGKGIFTMDFQNDGEYVGGCIAGGRNYFHINANGDAEPCVFIHYSGANIRTHSLLEILKQPLFMAYRDRQPFNENHLRPCPMLENPEILQQMVKETGAKSTDLQSPEDVTHLCGKCEEYARKWKPCAERLWAEEKHKKHSYENYKKK